MITEIMEAFSIEVGEQIVFDGLVYRVIESDYSEDFPDMWSFRVVDEEGLSRRMLIESHTGVEFLVE
jgi:hypothetical protein